MAVRFLIAWVLLGALPTGGVWAGIQCLACHREHHTAVGECVDCHRGDVRTQRIDVAHRELIGVRFAGFALPDDAQTAAGAQWLDTLACRRCHRVGGTGNPLAVGLDGLFWEAAPEEVEAALRTPVPGMPDFALSPAQRQAVVRALLRTSRHSERPTAEVPRIVHFEGAASSGRDPFGVHCGGCHRALTVAHGGLGQGSTGPNLSGLFSPYYPAPTATEDQRWDAVRLKRWLENPRALVVGAIMPPMRLNAGELEELLGIFSTDGETATLAPRAADPVEVLRDGPVE